MRRAKMVYPKSKLLWILLGWFASGAILHAVTQTSKQTDSLEAVAGNFFTDLLMPYLYGAFASQVLVVWALTVALGVVYALFVTNPFPTSVVISRVSLSCILLFSLFTIWIEPYATLRGTALALDAGAQLAKVPLKAIDLAVSIAWILLFFIASRAIGRDSVAYRKEMFEDIPKGTFKCTTCEGVEFARCKSVYGKWSRLLLYFLLVWPWLLVAVNFASGGPHDPGMKAVDVFVCGLLFMLPGVVFSLVASRQLMRCEKCGRQALAKDIRVNAFSSNSPVCSACGGPDYVCCKGVYGKWRRLVLYILLTWPWLLIGVTLLAGGRLERGAEWAMPIGVTIFMFPGAAYWLVMRRSLVRCKDCGRRSPAETFARYESPIVQ